MLIELHGRNFGCFRDDFCLSMLAADIDANSPRGIVEAHIVGDPEPLRLLRAVAIYGPNASGKSTVLRAAGALRNLIEQSAVLQSDEPLREYEPFGLGESSPPSRLGIKAVVDGAVYEYAVEFDGNKFFSEKLVRLNAAGAETVLIERTEQQVDGTWKQDPQFALIAQNFRQNALLLSLADRLAPGLAKSIAVGFRRLLSTRAPASTPQSPLMMSLVAKRARDDVKFRDWLLNHLKAADVGVVDLRTEQRGTFFRTRGAKDDDSAPDIPAVGTMYQMALMHQGGPDAFAVPYRRESQGTNRLIELAPILYDLATAAEARAAFVDEIHESLHPMVLRHLIEYFNCELPAEKLHGQLVFATHETALLDAEASQNVLRRDQIYLTEKDASGASRLYSVAEFRERNNLNLRRRYLQGRYGALPAFGATSEQCADGPGPSSR